MASVSTLTAERMRRIERGISIIDSFAADHGMEDWIDHVNWDGLVINEIPLCVFGHVFQAIHGVRPNSNEWDQFVDEYCTAYTTEQAGLCTTLVQCEDGKWDFESDNDLSDAWREWMQRYAAF